MTGPSPAVVRKVAEDLDAATLRVLAPTAEVLAQPDSAGQTALHLAVRARPDDDVTAVTSLLVAMRADLGLRNSRGETPLLLAVRAALAAGVQGDGPWLLPVRLMLEAKAAACASDNQGRAALTYSAAANNLSLCRLLLDFRADPEQRNASGATARSVASRQGHHHVVELLAQAARPVPPEAKPSVKPQTANRVPNPPQLSPLERLREECRRAQIPIDWCSTEEQLRELKGRWQHLSCLSMQQLVQEAKMQRINTQGASKPEELRKRLVQQHCWEMMTDQELQQCCFAQGVLFPKNCFNTQFAANREADRLDIITRLKEATFGLRPGEFGPLPVDPKNAAQPRGSTGFRPPPRPKARSPPRPAPEHKEEEAQDTGDRQTAAGPRVRRLLQEFPGFCGEMPGLEAETWSEQELKQYFYSNGYIRPKRREVHQPAREEASVRQHLATLGLKAPATAEAVKRAFRSLALKYHPDKRPDDQTRSADFQRIKDAYDALTAAGLA